MKKKNDYTVQLIFLLFLMATINVVLRIMGWSWGLLDFLVAILAIFWVMIMVYVLNGFKFKNPVSMMALGIVALVLAVATTISYLFIPITDIFMQDVFNGLLPLAIGSIVGIIFTIALGICNRKLN